MGVKVRPIHAGELGLAAHDNAAAAAHAGAVHHDGVQGDNGLDAVGAGHVRQELHHDVGADGDDPVKLGLAFGDVGVDLLLQVLGGEALLTIGAVIGAHDELIGNGGQLLLQDDDIGAAEAADEGDLHPGLVHHLGDGVGNGAAHAAADYADLLQALDLGGFAQGAHKVGDIVALLHGVEHSGGAAGGLHHDGDGALLPVPAGDRNRHTLALLIQAEDNELTGLGMLGHQGGLDLKEADGFRLVEKSLGYYFVHFTPRIVYSRETINVLILTQPEHKVNRCRHKTMTFFGGLFIKDEGNGLQGFRPGIFQAVALAVIHKGHVAGAQGHRGAVVAVFPLALENIVGLAVTVMDVPADLTARLQHQVVENAALAVHLIGAFQNADHLRLPLAAEHLLHIQGSFITSSDHGAALTFPALRQ